MARAELGHAQRQLAVAAKPLVEDLHVAGAVHRLQREDALVVVVDELAQAFLVLAEIHVLAELLPVARRLPQLAIDELRRLHFLIAGRIELAPQIALQRAPERPALRVPEHHAGGFFLLVEEAHLAAEAAMVALLGLLDAVQVGLQVLVGEEDRAVDALELGVVAVAAPVGARHLRQLERLAELARRGQVRTEAHVEPVALPVDRDLLVFRQLVGPFGFELLAVLDEVVLDLGTVPHRPLDRQVAVDDLGHALLDLREVVGREGLVAHEVVVEAVLRRGAERDLRAGVEFLHRLCQHVRRVVAQQFQRIGVARRDDADLRIAVDHMGEVDHLAVDAQREGGLGEAWADRGGDVRAADRFVEGPDRTVRQGNIDHSVHQLTKFRTKLIRRHERSGASRPGSRTSASPAESSSGGGDYGRSGEKPAFHGLGHSCRTPASQGQRPARR